MKDLLYLLVGLLARVHDRLLTLNEYFPTVLTDKQMHFLIFGLFGLALFCLLHPLIRALVRRGWIGVLSFLFTLLLVLLFAFAVEVGQHATGTGRLEVADITAGVSGFLCIGGAASFLYAALHFIRKWLRQKRDK